MAPHDVMPSAFASLVEAQVKEIYDLLTTKNVSYGNSALDPVRIFSRADTIEQLLVRIDDKLSRIKRGNSYSDDTLKDLIGYLIMLRIARQGTKAP